MKPRASLLRICCPHCDSPATTRSSRPVTSLYREIYYQCTNLECGHSFAACLEIIRTICPSQIPRAGIHLPTVPAAVRQANARALRRAGNDLMPGAANDHALLDADRIAAPRSG